MSNDPVTPHETTNRGSVLTSTVLRRRTDTGGPLFRSSRFFTVGPEWFAMVRGRESIGPFRSRDEAELRLAWHLADEIEQQAGEKASPAADRLHQVTPLEVQRDELLICCHDIGARGNLAACVLAKQRLECLEASEWDSQIPLRLKALRYFLDEVDGSVGTATSVLPQTEP